MLGLVVAPFAAGALVAGLDFSGLSVFIAFDIWAAATIAVAVALARSLRSREVPVAARVFLVVTAAVVYGLIAFPGFWLLTYTRISGNGIG